jgi:hypothetical protein
MEGGMLIDLDRGYEKSTIAAALVLAVDCDYPAERGLRPGLKKLGSPRVTEVASNPSPATANGEVAPKADCPGQA